MSAKHQLRSIHEVPEDLEVTAELPLPADMAGFVASASPKLSEEYFREFIVADEEYERCARCRPRRMVRR